MGAWTNGKRCYNGGMENENNGGKKLIVVVVVIIILAIIGAIWFSVSGSDKVPTPVENGTAVLGFEAAKEANQVGTLEVGIQFPGNTVYVAGAKLPAGGFVAVRQKEAGQPGAILGSHLFTVGSPIGNVDLSEATLDGQSYLAEAYTDNGDGVFDATTDQLIMNADNLPLRVEFQVTKDLPELKG